MESAKNAIKTADIAPPPCKALPITTNMILLKRTLIYIENELNFNNAVPHADVPEMIAS